MRIMAAPRMMRTVSTEMEKWILVSAIRTRCCAVSGQEIVDLLQLEGFFRHHLRLRVYTGLTITAMMLSAYCLVIAILLKDGFDFMRAKLFSIIFYAQIWLKYLSILYNISNSERRWNLVPNCCVKSCYAAMSIIYTFCYWEMGMKMNWVLVGG